MGLSDSDEGFLSIAKKSGATLLSPTYQLVTPEEVAAAHKAGLPVVPWTANRRLAETRRRPCRRDNLARPGSPHRMATIKKLRKWIKFA
jgi:glycerophosphoryl diester phosphodiesterase